MPALVDDDDAIGVAHGGQAVGDHQHGAAAHEVGQRLLHHELALGVEVGRRLVEDQDRRVLQEGAGDGQALALAAAESRTPRSPTSVS